MGKYVLLISRYTIKYSFYCLFFFIPLAYSGDTSEMFELNKTWLLFIFTIIIAVAWISKSIAKNKIVLRHTVFTIPLFLFLLSQTISTITSIDTHLSLWGFYGRFTGGYLSTLASIFLFFAFVSNMEKEHVKNTMYTALLASCIVLVIGYLGFFGYDSICNTITTTSNSTCWVDPNGPRIRMFSTIGNPNWLALYASISTIWIVGYLIYTKIQKLLTVVFAGITSLFYILILLTGSRSGFIGFLFALSFLVMCVLYIKRKHFIQYQRKTLILLLFLFSILSVIIGTPFTKRVAFVNTTSIQPVLANGKDESIKTRQYLWLGALRIFYHFPIFGSGVETFSLTYPQYRPVQHNMTQEWDFVYDKAHNEYLHLLANTGIFGLITYLLFIGTFAYSFYVSLLQKQKSAFALLPLIVFSSWLGIIVTNFFGFADATTGFFFYLLPALYIVMTGHNKTYTHNFTKKPNVLIQNIAVCLVIVIGGGSIALLLERWYADAEYARGYRYDQRGDYITAHTYLLSAMYYWKTEPTYANEYAINSGHLAVMHNKYGQKKLAVAYTKQAKTISDTLIFSHVINSELWESRTFLFQHLAEINPLYGHLSIDAARQATILSPTSAKYRYVLALQYKNAHMVNDAKKTLQEALLLKPNYIEAKQMQKLLEQKE